MNSTPHQYIERESGQPRTETLYADGIVRFLYCRHREETPFLLRAFTSRWASSLLGFLNFDLPLVPRIAGLDKFLKRMNIDISDCLDSAESLDTFRKIFERKIRYWETRPLPAEENLITSPSDSKVLLGSFRESSALFIKKKFFSFEELLGEDKPAWLQAFREGEYALFRLTPEKYHYNHTPVAGRVVDFYEIPGVYHSCNPGAILCVPHPYSKNRRAVTIFQTDTEGGTGAGLVAMVEVAALMIGDIVQRYSDERYDDPLPLSRGMFVRRGQPKSLFRPGSSSVVLIFQPGRVVFSPDLIRNQHSRLAQNRFSEKGNIPLVETEVKVRSPIARAVPKPYTEKGDCPNE
ncbi:MAG: phosphatidylserine decarboxylase [Syntrophaceae bacterium]|nr:phosphatidylserine decarboxylase [Syntrophaceae bacterium]